MGFSPVLEHMLLPHVVQQLGLSRLLWEIAQVLENQVLTMLCCKPLSECLRVLTVIIFEMSLIAEGDFAGFESIPPS